MRSAFEIADTNGDGVLTYTEAIEVSSLYNVLSLLILKKNKHHSCLATTVTLEHRCSGKILQQFIHASPCGTLYLSIHPLSLNLSNFFSQSIYLPI